MSPTPKDNSTPLMSIAVHSLLQGLYREVSFRDHEGGTIAWTGLLNAAERVALAARLREVAAELVEGLAAAPAVKMPLAYGNAA